MYVLVSLDSAFSLLSVLLLTPYVSILSIAASFAVIFCRISILCWPCLTRSADARESVQERGDAGPKEDHLAIQYLSKMMGMSVSVFMLPYFLSPQYACTSQVMCSSV